MHQQLNLKESLCVRLFTVVSVIEYRPTDNNQYRAILSTNHNYVPVGGSTAKVSVYNLQGVPMKAP